MLQPLELRQFLSATLKSGVLLVQGTAGNDSISLGVLILPDDPIEQPFSASAAPAAAKPGGDRGPSAGLPMRLLVYLNDDVLTFDYYAVRRVRIYGAAGDDNIFHKVPLIGAYLHGGAGNDIFQSSHPSGAADTIIGGPGHDFLAGGVARDILRGGLGNDSLHGGAGRDALYGGDGDDLLSGNQDADALFGQAGRDTFASADAPTERRDFNRRRDRVIDNQS
jgi:hypothetical protein